MKVKKILVVDDEEMIRSMVSDFLQLSGFEVETAEDGVEALDVLGRVDGVDLVLTDLMMPRMNGFQLIRKIREIKKYLLIILMSGLEDSKQKGLADTIKHSDWVKAVFQKPFNPEELVNFIKSL